MKELSIHTVKQVIKTDYNDENIVIINGVSGMKGKILMPISVKSVFLIFITEGSCNIRMNGTAYNLNPHMVLVCSPNCIIDNYSAEKNFNAKIIGFSLHSINNSLQVSKNLWHNLYHIKQHPLTQLSETDSVLFLQYYSIAKNNIKNEYKSYQKEIMHSLLSCLIYEMLGVINRSLPEFDRMEDNVLRQSDLICKRFLELVSQSNGKIRSVAQAADKLNVSSKYLSSVIKVSSGKNALEIIHRYILNEITQMLKYSDLSIQEISNKLDFPSLSFFGKFFKQQTGMSPKQYRKKLLYNSD